MPTIFGLRRRGYTASSIRLFCDRTAVSKSDSRIDYSLLEQAVRDDLDPVAARSVAVLDPLAGHHQLPRGPERNLHGAAQSARPRGRPARIPADARTLIERDDFREEAPKKYFRLFPGNTVRLKYGYVVRCTGFTKNEAGEVVEVQAEYLPDTKSGTPAPTASRSRATSPGSAPRMPCPRRSICMTACSPTRVRTAATRIS